MKTKNYLSILALICATSLNAQVLLSDFEGGGVGLSVSYMNLDTAAIVANPALSGGNTSDSVLIYDRINDGSYDSIWNSIVFLKPLSTQGTQDFTRLFFKVYANVSGEFYIRIWTGGTQLVQAWAMPTQITAGTWEQQSFDITCLNWYNIDSISLEFGDWTRTIDSTNAVTGDGYIVYVDDIELGYYLCKSINCANFPPETFDAFPALGEVVLDGINDEDSWVCAGTAEIIKLAEGEIADKNDCSGTMQATWDDEYLYLYLDILDDDMIDYDGSGATQPGNMDGIEIYTDGKAINYECGRNFSHQLQSRINLGRADADCNVALRDTIVWAEYKDLDGYQLEIAIPFFQFYRPYEDNDAAADSVVASRADDRELGFEISILDAGSIDTLSAVVNWSNPTGENISYTQSKYYGRIIPTYIVIKDACTNIKDRTGLIIKLYPNPTERYVNVEMINLEKVEIYSIDGRLLLQQKAENGYAKVDVSTLKSGMYLIKASIKDNQFTTAKFQKNQ